MVQRHMDRFNRENSIVHTGAQSLFHGKKYFSLTKTAIYFYFWNYGPMDHVLINVLMC